MHALRLSTLTLCALLASAAGAAPAVPKPAPRDGAAPAAPDPTLPNVLLLGDSISMGYTPHTRALLAGKANVYRAANDKGAVENCAGTTHGLQRIDAWIGTTKWAVIHFNWGLHDLKRVQKNDSEKPSTRPDDPPQATAEKYAANLAVLVKKLQATGAKLIFATTTPVPNEVDPKAVFRAPADVQAYNAAALKVLEGKDIAVDDLFAFAQKDLKRIQRPANVHFTDDGSRALAGEVAKSIERVLRGTP